MVLAGLALVALTTAPAIALYESATAPPPPDLGAAPGSTGTTDLTVSVPPSPERLDLDLLLDLSGSYSDDLPNMQALLPGLLDRLAAETSLLVSVSTFIDDPCCGGDPSDYPYRRLVPMTQDARAAGAALARLETGSGGDEPESWLFALDRMMDEANYRQDATHVVVLATDAPSHSVSDGSGSTAPTAEQVAGRLRDADVRLIGVIPGSASADLQELAAATDGSIQRGSRTSDDIELAVLRGLEEVLVTITPTLRNSCPIDVMTFDPPSAIDVRGGSTFRFDATYEVAADAPAGDYVCVVDLGEAGTTTIDLRVAA